MGPDVKDLAIGQKVTYTNAGVGTYSTHVAVRAIRIMVVPDGLDDIRVAAGGGGGGGGGGEREREAKRSLREGARRVDCVD